MKLPCEVVTSKVLPALRALVVRRLSEHYMMRQVDIAGAMGITQASVSQYLNEIRGADLKVIAAFPELQDHAIEIGTLVAKGVTLDELQEKFCEVCTAVRQTEAFAAYFGEAMGGHIPIPRCPLPEASPWFYTI